MRELGEGVCSGERVRESDLNVVGPKTVEIISTGQTGCPDRSDRSGWVETQTLVL